MRNATLLTFVLLAVGTSGFGQDNNMHPHVVATYQLYGQTGATSPVTIYTPKRSGMFRVSSFMVMTVNGGSLGSYYEPIFGFTDQRGSDFVGAAICEPESCPNANYVNVLAAKGGQPITFWMLSFDDVSGTKYDVFVVVEELWSAKTRTGH